MSGLLRVGAFATVALAATLTALLAARSPDTAKAAITSTSPMDGARLAQAPAEVELSSTGPLVLDQSHVSVWDGSGTALNNGEPILVVPERLRQPVTITTAGDVTVTYHVTFIDGAELAGTLHFSVGIGRATGTGASMEPSAATTNTNDAVSGSTHDHGIDPISAAMLVLDSVVAIAVIVVLVRRPRPKGAGHRTTDVTTSHHTSE
jgi:methionine-rich copper-binding protein CopC